MPQEFHVLQCHKCKTFQVQQVKKVLKWCCKLCGEKQSVLRVYGRGSGADCRKHVQSLNKLRGEMEASQEEMIVSAKSVEEADVHFHQFQIDASEVESNIQNSSSSKWDRYVEPLINEDDGNDGREDDGNVGREDDGNVGREDDSNDGREDDGNDGREDDGREDDSNVGREDDGNDGREDDGNVGREDDGNVGREDDSNDGREDEGRYTTDRAQYNTLNKQYRKHKRDNYKQNQPYPRDRNKTDNSSRWKNQTPKNMGGNYEENFNQFDQSSESNINRLPPACLSSIPAKRTKWDNFLGAQNQENTHVSSHESNFNEQPYRTVLKTAFAPETKIVKPDFNLLDSFLNEDFEEPNLKSTTANNITKMITGNGNSKISTSVQPSNGSFEKSTVSSGRQAKHDATRKTTISNGVPQKKSKWEVYKSTSPDHDSEFYIPNDNSLDFETLNTNSKSNYDEDAPGFDNFDFFQTQNEEDHKGTLSQIGHAQVHSSIASYTVKPNPEKVPPSISGSKTFNVLKCESKTPGNKVSASRTISAKLCSKDGMFHVNDFDDTEFEFVI